MLLHPSRRKIKRLADLVGYEDALIFAVFNDSPVADTIALLDGFNEKLKNFRLHNVDRIVEEEDGLHIFIDSWKIYNNRSIEGLLKKIVELRNQAKIDMVKDGLERGVLKKDANGEIVGDELIIKFCRKEIKEFAF